MANTIYTHTEAANIVDLFENVLDKYDIRVPSPEDDQRGEENDAKLYGSVYDKLLDDVENSLINLLVKATLKDTVLYSYSFNPIEQKEESLENEH